MAEEPRDQPVTIGRYLNPVEAHANRAALVAAGIDVFVLDETASNMAVGIETRLQVRAGDESAALAILRADPVPGSALPAELAEGPCPKCGSTDVSQVAEIPGCPVPMLGDWKNREWSLRCAACGHSWEDDEKPRRGVAE